MAKFNPPTNFPFNKPTEWPEWKQRFERYRLATKLNKDDGEVQVSCLIYAMGPEAENIYKSFTFAGNDERNDFAAVVGKFDEYFFPRRTIIHEWVCFHQRVQRPGEKAEGFIRALYDLSEPVGLWCNQRGEYPRQHLRRDTGQRALPQAAADGGSHSIHDNIDRQTV